MKLKALWWYLFNRKKYHNYRILLWIKEAKKEYKDHPYIGLCTAFNAAKPDEFFAEHTYEVISEYYPEFFDTKEIQDGSEDTGFWWPR